MQVYTKLTVPYQYERVNDVPNKIYILLQVSSQDFPLCPALALQHTDLIGCGLRNSPPFI